MELAHAENPMVCAEIELVIGAFAVDFIRKRSIVQDVLHVPLNALDVKSRLQLDILQVG